MSKIGDVLACLFLASAAWARAETPTSLEQLSPVERQQHDFYGAIAGTGPAIAVSWTLGAASVPLGGDIELTLLVKHAVNAAELERPDLAERPEWKELFASIADVPDADPGTFRYRLKPRNIGRWELPVPKYRFYDPRPPEGRRFQLAFARGPTLVVEPAAVVGPTLRIPMEAPSRFFDEPPLSTRTSAAPPAVYWWALLVVGVCGPPTWVAVWRWRNPDAARVARIRRAKSVRAALDALGRADHAEVAVITLRYLRERWRLPALAQTPREVAAALRMESVPDERLREAEALLNRCDAARFGAGDDNGLSLAAEARVLVERWEGLPV